jgi:hypothetical protein
MRLVETRAKPRLLAAFLDGMHDPAAHVSDQKLDRIGADIDDRASHRFHEVRGLEQFLSNLPK